MTEATTKGKRGAIPRAGVAADRLLRVRSTEAEMERWKAAAAAEGQTLSGWVRGALDRADLVRRLG